jgi:hypothetical protein
MWFRPDLDSDYEPPGEYVLLPGGWRLVVVVIGVFLLSLLI